MLNRSYYTCLVVSIVCSTLTSVLTYFGRGGNWNIETWFVSSLTISAWYLFVPIMLYITRIGEN